MTDFADIEKAAKAFNERYGVHFSIGVFEEKARTSTVIGGSTNQDDLYKNTFIELYKNAFANFVDRTIGNELDCGKMIREFDKEIMAPYRQWCKDQALSSPKPYGGWSTTEYLKTVSNYLSGLQKNKIGFAEERYKNGELPIRQMRAYSEKLMAGANKPTAEQLSTLYCYAKALKNVNESRPSSWMLRHPVRYLAESREANEFSAYIDEVTGMNQNSASNVNNETSAIKSTYAEMMRVANDNIIERALNIVQETVKGLEAKEQADKQASVNKERISVGGAEMRGDLVHTFNKINEKEVPSVSKKNGIG